MESSVVKFSCLVAFLFLVTVSCFAEVHGAGSRSPCGNNSPDAEAMNLAPCYMAAQDDKSSVPDSCCTKVKNIGQNPSCLCAVLLSNSAKMSGIKPENAITIPKRCNFANRPVGYKCGPYTLP